MAEESNKQLSREELEGRKEFYKMLLSTTKTLEDKLDELWDLPTEDLQVLLQQFEAEEEFENCHAIKTVLDDRKLNGGQS